MRPADLEGKPTPRLWTQKTGQRRAGATGAVGRNTAPTWLWYIPKGKRAHTDTPIYPTLYSTDSIFWSDGDVYGALVLYLLLLLTCISYIAYRIRKKRECAAERTGGRILVLEEEV